MSIVRKPRHKQQQPFVIGKQKPTPEPQADHPEVPMLIDGQPWWFASDAFYERARKRFPVGYEAPNAMGRPLPFYVGMGK